MSIAHPLVLLLLLLLVPVTGIFVIHFRRSRADIAAVLGTWREGEYLTRREAVYFFRCLSFSLFYVSIILALAGVSWGVRPVLERHSGIEIACTLDISRSMELKDTEPSRLRRSVELCQQLVSALPGTRFSMTVFKGDAVTEIPATEDAASIAQFLPQARPTLMTARGTDLERGIEAAIESFHRSDASTRLIVLFSDGESLSGNPLAAARLAKSKGIRIFAVGAGTEDGALVATGTGGTVRSRLKPDVLRSVAELSDGAYYPISSPRLLRDIMDAAKVAGVAGLSETYRYEPVDRYQVFLGVAIACLVIWFGIGAVAWVKK